MIFTQMTRTTSNKLFLGREYINKLSPTHLCTSFHGGVTKCKCIQNVKEHLDDVKQFFLEEIEEFWKISAHWKHRTDAKTIGHFFGEFLYERCTHISRLSKYVYHIADKDMEFCLDTLTSIYGLNQKAMTASRELLIDRKAIGLNLLKKACGEDWKSNKKLYWIYTNWFGHQIVPMGPKNSSACSILKKLGGFMVQLDEGSMKAIDYINNHHSPKYSDLNNVSNGGDNIRFAGPGNGLPDWGSFDGKRVLQPFINQVHPALFDHWKNKDDIVFRYETSFIYSKLGDTRDNVPQKAHQDHESSITDEEFDTLGIKSMIGFTPISEDGMMVVVWTEKTQEVQVQGNGRE